MTRRFLLSILPPFIAGWFGGAFSVRNMPKIEFVTGSNISWPQRKVTADGDQYYQIMWSLKMRRAIGRILPHTNYSTCSTCDLPWYVADTHSIKVDDSTGLFACCTKCWNELGYERCIPYYEAYVRKYYPGDEEKMKTLHQNASQGGWIFTEVAPDSAHDEWLDLRREPNP